METIKIRDWRGWEVVKPASKDNACVRQNPDNGFLYEWVSGGKRVRAKRVYKV